MLDDDAFNRALFDSLTANEWSREDLEAFVCLGCGRLFVGAPYAHALFLNAQDLSSRMQYNLPQGTRCPTCGNVLQGKGQRIREAADADIAESPWGWLLND